MVVIDIFDLLSAIGFDVAAQIRAFLVALFGWLQDLLGIDL